MNIEDILIKKEEVPMGDSGRSVIPVHPKLLSEEVQLDPRLAHNLFPAAVKDWYEELTGYVAGLNEGQSRNWIQEVFLSDGFEVVTGDRYQHAAGGVLEDGVKGHKKNGFAGPLSIGGSCACIGIDGTDNGSNHIIGVDFDEEKWEFFKGSYTYSGHNLDSYPMGLFARNWALIYINECLKISFDSS